MKISAEKHFTPNKNLSEYKTLSRGSPIGDHQGPIFYPVLTIMIPNFILEKHEKGFQKILFTLQSDMVTSF